MATIGGIFDDVSSIIFQCIQASKNEDIAVLDSNLTSLMHASFQVGDLLNEVLVLRQISIEEETLSNLNELRCCLNQLCLEYERKIYLRLSVDLSSDTSPRGRPKKTINIGLVSIIVSIVVAYSNGILFILVG